MVLPSRADYPKALLNELTELFRKWSERSCTSSYEKYFRDPRCLTDLVRCCVIVDSIQDVCTCLEEIFSLAAIETETKDTQMENIPLLSADGNHHDKVLKLTKVKDRFSSNARIGYRDICLNIEVAWKIESERQEEEIEFVPVTLSHCTHVRSHICEVQVLLNSTYQLKAAGGHESFVQVRNLISE